MRDWFRRRGGPPASNEAAAYREGRIDEQNLEGRPTVSDPPRHARVSGPGVPRRQRRGGFSLFSLIVLLLVIFGGVMIYLAAQNGSFSNGGAVVDHSISNAGAPIRNAEDRAGMALESAGRHLKRDAGPAGK